MSRRTGSMVCKRNEIKGTEKEKKTKEKKQEDDHLQHR